MNIYAIVNQKGGSAKTSTAINLSSTLSEQGKKVLLIDFDPQASASAWLGYKEPDKGLFSVMTENGNLSDIIIKTDIPNLEIVLGSPWLIGIDKALASEMGAEAILKRKISAIKEKRWDYIFLDCPPSLSILSINALTAADRVIVPLAPRIMEVQGLVQLMNTINTVKERLNPSLDLEGIVACRVDLRTNLSKDVIKRLREKFGEKVYNTAIRENVRMAETYSFGKPVNLYDPKSTAAQDYRLLAHEFIKRTS